MSLQLPHQNKCRILKRILYVLYGKPTTYSHECPMLWLQMIWLPLKPMCKINNCIKSSEITMHYVHLIPKLFERKK